MSRNVEIKAKINDVVRVTEIAAAIADQGPFELAQDDTFFQCPNGLLKLRVIEGSGAELIYYNRANEFGPKVSSYTRAEVSDAPALRDALTLAYGQTGRVRKRRNLYLVGRTRIHIDDVEGLGDFLELEVVLQDHEDEVGGREEAATFMQELEIQSSDLIKGSYVDLLASSAPNKQFHSDVLTLSGQTP